MRVSGVICVFAGHRWGPVEDFHEAYPLFECRRRGRRQEFAAGTSAAGYNKRLEARTGADKIFPGSGGRR